MYGVFMFRVCVSLGPGAPVMKCEVILLISNQLLKAEVHPRVGFSSSLFLITYNSIAHGFSRLY